MTTRAQLFNPIFDAIPGAAVRPQALTSGSAVNGKAIDLLPISGHGLGLIVPITLTMGAGPAAADSALVEVKIQHSDSSTTNFTDYKTLDSKSLVVGSGAGVHNQDVVYPRINLEGAKRYVRVVLEVTADAGNTGTISGIIGSAVYLLAAGRQDSQDAAYDQDGYVATSKVAP